MKSIPCRAAIALLAALLCAVPARADHAAMYESYAWQTTDHFYTTNPWERDLAISYGFVYYGVPFYVERNPEPNTLPFRRFYQWYPRTDHFYTTDQGEADFVQQWGWSPEGNEGHLYTWQVAGTVPLYRFSKWDPYTNDLDHAYTTNYYSIPWYWTYDHVAGYVLTQPGPSDTEYVTSLYRDVLGREPDGGGLYYWVTGIQYSWFTRDQVRAYFVASPEYQQRIDRSYLLDGAWACGGAASRWDTWKKSVLLYAAANGYGFKAFCNRGRDQGATGTTPRSSIALVVFRDRGLVAQAVAWYDAQLDGRGNGIFGGIMPVRAGTYYDIRHSDYRNYPLYTAAQRQDFWAWAGPYHEIDPNFWQRILVALSQTSTYVAGCVPPFSGCGSGSFQFQNDAARAVDSIYLDISTPDGEGVSATYSAGHSFEASTFDRIFNVVLAIGLTIQGGIIGEAIGLVGAADAAFAAGYGAFTSGLLQGLNPRQALRDALTAAAVAYVGHMVLDAFGNPQARVGVEGLGCPRGDQCWYFQLADRFPPLHNLAELHDTFITFSVNALGSIADNGWYLAVTIPPFLVPGCASVPACTVAGIVIVRENERP